MEQLKTPKQTRSHRGDIMSPQKRSAVMSRIRGRDTKPEKAVEMMLREIGIDFESHCRDLPGRPDFVLRNRRIVIFVDGYFLARLAVPGLAAEAL